jgi:8-oxo-dGTP pyrophosphatase MutT (NUDIX family)
METNEYTSAGGVIIHHKQMLLLERPARGEVRLPKGHVEPGEEIEAAALRETMEESGFGDLSIVAALGSQIVEFDFEGRHVVRTEHFFLMRLNSLHQVQRNAKDENQFRVLWTPLDDATNLLTFANERDVALRAIRLHRDGAG